MELLPRTMSKLSLFLSKRRVQHGLVRSLPEHLQWVHHPQTVVRVFECFLLCLFRLCPQRTCTFIARSVRIFERLRLPTHVVEPNSTPQRFEKKSEALAKQLYALRNVRQTAR